MKLLNKLYLIISATVILLTIGLYNGYPLIYSDTGTYIYSGFTFFVPQDRPVIYGLFVKLFSLNRSLWFVVIIQNFITAFVLFEVCYLFFTKERLKLYYLTIITFLTLFTGIGWYTNQIMPDFFSAIVGLLIYLLLCVQNTSSGKTTLLMLLLAFSVTVHFSHLLLSFSIIIVFLLANCITRNRQSVLPGMLTARKTLAVTAIALSGWLIIPAVNYILEKDATLSKGSHVFFMAHLIDNGLLKKFLKDNCTSDEFKDCKLCKYKDSLPTDLGNFLWEKDGVLKKTGGWDSSKTEYKKIIKATFTKPKYLFSHFNKTVLYTCIQLTRNEIGQGLFSYPKSSQVYTQIYWKFNDELNNYINSKQYSNNLSSAFHLINTLNFVVNIFCVFILFILFCTSLFKQINPLSFQLLLFSIISVLLNAVFTAGLNAPSDRFQARISWLIPFALIIVIFSNIHLIKNSFKK